MKCTSYGNRVRSHCCGEPVLSFRIRPVPIRASSAELAGEGVGTTSTHLPAGIGARDGPCPALEVTGGGVDSPGRTSS